MASTRSLILGPDLLMFNHGVDGRWPMKRHQADLAYLALVEGYSEVVVPVANRGYNLAFFAQEGPSDTWEVYYHDSVVRTCGEVAFKTTLGQLLEAFNPWELSTEEVMRRVALSAVEEGRWR